MNRLKLLMISFFVLLGCLEVSAQFTKQDKELFAKAYILKPEEIRLVEHHPNNKKNSTFPKLFSIERKKNETLVTFIQPIYFDSQWLFYSPNYTIINKRNGDEYIVRSYLNKNIPMENLVTVKNCNNKYIYVTLVFPKLKKNARFIDIIERDSGLAMPSNDDGIAKNYYSVYVHKYAKINKKFKNRKVYR